MQDPHKETEQVSDTGGWGGGAGNSMHRVQLNVRYEALCNI